MASISSHLALVCLFFSLISILPQSSTSTPDSVLNIEAFFPTAAPPPPPPTTTDLISLPPSPAPQPSSASSQSNTASSQRIILAAVVSSVATTLAVSTLLFLYVQIRSSPMRREEKRPMPSTPEAKPVDGLERRVQRGREMLRYGKSKSTSKVLDIESVERVQELPLLPSDVRRSHHLQHPLAGEAAIGALPKSSSAPEARRGTSTNSSTSPILPDAADHHALFTNNKTTEKSKEFNSDSGDDKVLSSSASQRPPPPLPNLLPLPLPPSMVAKRILASMAVPPPPSSTTEEGEEHIGSTTHSRSRTSLPLPPKPPSTPSKMMEKVALPAPAPPPKVHPTPPPAPPPPPPPLKVLSKAEAAPPPQPPRPPPPPRRNGSSSSTTSRPPPPERKLGRQRNEEQSTRKETGIALKPLHWDKVTPDSDHSMVWDNIGNSSFRVNDDRIASLFGNLPPKQHQKSAFHAQETQKHYSASTSANQGILDPRRSQNIAIILRSLSVRRQDIIDAVKDGRGLSSDTLDKIRKIAPNDEEHARLLEFAGEDDSGLSDTEAFLRRLITTVPSAFRRVDTMHFVSTFGQELANVKGSIQSMEMACKELRSSGLFVKLLEVVLKAGNRMNAGTARGNARAFNLSALKKLSDVKSIDGKTNLLHFVVQQLVRSEGKKCALLNHDSISDVQGEEREQEYMRLGLPVIGGLSVELGNVKKAAAVDYDSLVGSYSTMAAGVEEVKRLLLDGTRDDQNERDGFVREMRKFALKAEEEAGLIREEQNRVLDLVNRTYEYYQPGVSKEKGSQPMQLFVIVKDFLGMVDQACVDIARVQQQKRKKALAAIAGRASPEGLSDQPSPVKVLPPSSLLGSKFKTTSPSSDSEEGFRLLGRKFKTTSPSSDSEEGF